MTLSAGGPPRLASVVVTSFNYERYLVQALDSALSQTGPRSRSSCGRWLDHGSRAIIEGDGRRVQAVFKSTGVRFALNVGFAKSRGASWSSWIRTMRCSRMPSSERCRPWPIPPW